MSAFGYVTHCRLMDLLLDDGFVCQARSSNHATFWHPSRLTVVTIPVEGLNLGEKLVSRLLGDLKFIRPDGTVRKPTLVGARARNATDKGSRSAAGVSPT
jgi:hypothetical protein